MLFARNLNQTLLINAKIADCEAVTDQILCGTSKCIFSDLSSKTYLNVLMNIVTRCIVCLLYRKRAITCHANT